MRFIDFFSGVGGFTRGMELAGHKCVGHCEIDKYAEASYRSMHTITEAQRSYLQTLTLQGRQIEILKEDYLNGEWYAADIRRVFAGDIPHADCWCFGFPCQDISICGKQLGFKGNRSSLFFRVMYLVGQLADEEKPEWLLIENVKNLLSVNGGWDFARLLCSLDESGYDAEWDVLNSKHYGSPQNRERVFIIGHNRNSDKRRIFPIKETTDGILKSVQCDTSGKGLKSQQDRFYLADGIMCCLPNARAKTKCITFIDNKPHVLTARERMRIQGFDDPTTDKAYFINKPDEIAKQAGNGVTVNVIYEIAKRLTL